MLGLCAVIGCGEPRVEAGPPPATASGPASPVAYGPFQACTPRAAELCLDAVDNNCNGIIDEGCGLTTGLVQFVIAWTKRGADVDLNVTDPNGELVEVGSITRSGFVKERDCPGRANACRGRNLENVFLEADEDVPRGTFRVQVRLEKLGQEEPPVVVSLGVRAGPKTYSMEVSLLRAEDEVEVPIKL